MKNVQYADQKKVSSNQVEKLIKASYKMNGKAKKIGAKNGFKLDKSLSNREAKVFIDADNNPNVVYTGSRKASDWVTNAQLAVGLLGNTQRLKRSQNLMNEVKTKYKNKPVTTIGHSLGGSLAESVGGDKAVITVNKGVGLAGIGKKINANQTDIRTGTDPVSILSRFQTGGKKIIIPNTNYVNPLKAHSFNDVSSLKIKI